MMQDWFPDAKLGIFIHYGIYAVKGISESWSWYQGQVTKDEYFDQLSGFTADKYDPDEWGRLFAAAGAKYAVLTTKHHDGVALFDTKFSDLNVIAKTPAGRDLIRPYCEAMRKHGLKVGFYFSHLDWSHPDYASVEHDDKEHYVVNGKPGISYPADGRSDPVRWERFLEFHRAQLKELCTQYGTVDLLWFDGEWERSPAQWRMKELRDLLLSWQPNCIFNARLLGYGDYPTPEQGIPTRPPADVWELCITINDSWGYQVQDHNHKPLRHIVRIFAETIGMGGNLLLDVGPYADGSLQPEQVDRLNQLGRWVNKHAEAIYGTRPGLPAGLYGGPSTVSKDGTKLYLFVFDKPLDQVFVKGIWNKVLGAEVVGTGQKLNVQKLYGTEEWGGGHGVPRMTFIDCPEDALDATCTVIRLDLDGPLNPYVGGGRE